jgi:hypothetical protein
MHKIEKPLVNLTKMRRENTQICKIRSKKGVITTNTKQVITDFFEKLYLNKLENLEEMDKFPDTYDHPKINHDDINHPNKCITCNEIEAAIVSPKKEKSRT